MTDKVNLRSVDGKLPRRSVLKIGAGMGALVVFGIPSFSRVPPRQRRVDHSSAHVGQVMKVTGSRILVQTEGGQAVSASLSGFPNNLQPRVGDVVWLSQLSSSGTPLPPQMGSPFSPQCAPIGGLITGGQPVATPMISWTKGTPTVATNGTLMIGNIQVMEVPSVRRAAEQGKVIVVATLDSTLPTRQVVVTRAA